MTESRNGDWGMGETLENLEGMNEAQLRELIQHAQEQLRQRVAKRLEELKQAAQEAGYAATITKIGGGREPQPTEAISG